MVNIEFEGQQSDERVLYVIKPHELAKYLAILKVILLSVFLLLITFFIANFTQAVGGYLRLGGIIFSIILLLVGIWWNTSVYAKSKTYITDRRIIRFEVVSPFFLTKRALFWNEALKAKGYAPNLIYRFLKIGTVQVEPHLAEHEDVKVTDVYYFEDLANYIDKILFTFKNKPDEVASLQPFIPKPRGQRG